MASYGWQGRQDIFTAHRPHMALDLYVYDVVHTGNWTSFKAVVRVWVTYGWINCNNITIAVDGGGTKTINMNQQATSYVDTATFDCGLALDAQYDAIKIHVSMSSGCRSDGGSGPNIGGTAEWWIQTGAGGAAPTGANAIYNGSTWNSVDATATITSWNNSIGEALQYNIVTGSYNGAAANAGQETWGDYGRYCYNKTNTWDTSFRFNGTGTNASYTLLSPIPVKGLLCYRLLCWAKNAYGMSYRLGTTIRYLPPAKPQFTYTDPGGTGTKVYAVSLAGDLTNNHTTYDAPQLTRSIRYKIDSGNWVTVDNNTVAALDFVTSFSVSVPAGSTATVEGWMTYHGMQSEVQTITITNSTTGVALYGSVNGETKMLGPVYASVNGRTRKLKKIYASAGGVTKKVYEDV